jgi:nitrate reductase gamma subunit
MCISWGTMLAFALTFPLVFGWVHFESLASDPKVYDVLVFGFKVDRFHVQSLKAILMFNLLNLASVLLLIGVIMAGWRRWQDAGERATQTFSEDILPLIILFAVGATGLMLTVNARLMAGTGFATFAIIHMVCVIVLLLYLPFGKLLHVWQRSGHLMVSFFKKAHASDMACCRRCKREYAMKQQISDLKEVLENLGFNYRFVADNGLAVHYQDICPPCRRSLLALNQGASLGR